MKYEAPEIVEIGQAEELVMGAGGPFSDCCNCSGRKDPNIDSDDDTV
ncbi:MAG TPA: hypothetical protein VJU77_13805 [Chthoniobacterales bacterium]|nr:hypothetical protein [Chthoniobacterales bacterium]